MLKLPGGESSRHTRLQIHLSDGMVDDQGTVSEMSDEGALTATEFGLAESGIVIESENDAEYSPRRTITGFAPGVDDYVDEGTETFPAIQNFKYTVLKRVFDIVFSAAAILVVSPLMLVIAAAIKFTSRGPVFFVQDRVGNAGIFRMVKFRSMYLNDQSETHHTSFGDPRITGVGVLLRRTSLDELPQLFNVLKGEMSIVGPRPELVKFVEKFAEEIPGYMSRHTGKGGVTGWAQVHGLRGSGTSIATRIDYDLEYLSNWSFWLDLKIILMTIQRGLTNNAF